MTAGMSFKWFLHSHPGAALRAGVIYASLIWAILLLPIIAVVMPDAYVAADYRAEVELDSAPDRDRFEIATGTPAPIRCVRSANPLRYQCRWFGPDDDLFRVARLLDPVLGSKPAPQEIIHQHIQLSLHWKDTTRVPIMLGIIQLVLVLSLLWWQGWPGLTLPPARTLWQPLVAVGIYVAISTIISTLAIPQHSTLTGLTDSLPSWQLTPLHAVLFAPIIEELTFRSAGWQVLRRTFSAPLTILITAASFSGLHGIQYSFVWLVPIFVFGLLLGWMRERSGSVLLPVLAHMGANALALATLAP